MHRHGGDELGLASGLNAEVILETGIHDLLHHLAELVHLDGEDPAVLVLVGALGDGPGKGFVETTHTITKQVMATHQQREAKSTITGLVDEFHQIDFLTILTTRAYHSMPGLVDFHISLGPSLHVVEGSVLSGDGSGWKLGHFDELGSVKK